MDAVERIKQLYYRTSAATIERDLVTAIAMLKTLGSEEERERAAAYMDGLSQMRSEWAAEKRPARSRTRPPRSTGSVLRKART